MTDTTRHDAWQAGDSYDAYMGRWSRKIAPHFLDWIDASGGLDWLEAGCGTGALSAAILARCHPRSLLGIDQSGDFVRKARANVPDVRARFETGDAQALPSETDSIDVAVSALVLNFVPDKVKALAEMRRVTRPEGTVAFYVWDYPRRGVEFMNVFWEAAAALDPTAADLSEDKRFPFCTPDGLAELALAAGLETVDTTHLEETTVFRDFDDYWRPFTLGAGPAPGYCASLAPEARERLREKLEGSLPRSSDGSIRLKTRAWAVKARPG